MGTDVQFPGQPTKKEQILAQRRRNVEDKGNENNVVLCIPRLAGENESVE